MRGALIGRSGRSCTRSRLPRPRARSFKRAARQIQAGTGDVSPVTDIGARARAGQGLAVPSDGSAVGRKPWCSRQTCDTGSSVQAGRVCCLIWLASRPPVVGWFGSTVAGMNPRIKGVTPPAPLSALKYSKSLLGRLWTSQECNWAADLAFYSGPRGDRTRSPRIKRSLRRPR